jgi:hypothetical protein
MAYLLRRLSDIDAWAEASESSWDDNDCPHELMRQIYDNSPGVSTWRVEAPDDVMRAVTAQQFLRSTIADFPYCLIDEKDIAEHGIETDDKRPGKTPDKDINKLHVELVKMSPKQVAALAHLIKDKCQLDVIKRSEILETAATCFSEGKFDRESLFNRGGKLGRSDAEITVAKDLLVHLWKKGDIKITQQQTQTAP